MRFFHKHLRRLLLFFLKRHPSLALDVLRHHPSLALDALRQQNSLSFANCPDRQQRNFEDLDWLLVSNLTNRGLLRLAFDEAAFLFRLVRSQPAAQILEIGRYHGGSAFLFAVASDHNSMVTSIDIAPQNDELLQIALKKSGLAYKVQLLVGDSNRGEARVDFYNLIFVDGDHSYEGVLKDYEHWRKAVKPGGCLAFHNAAAGRPHTLLCQALFDWLRKLRLAMGSITDASRMLHRSRYSFEPKGPFLNAKKSATYESSISGVRILKSCGFLFGSKCKHDWLTTL